jgi:putative ABC transport system permease protein
MLQTAVGLTTGVSLSLLLSQSLTGLLFGVSTTDFATFAGVVLLLAAVSMLAMWIPARRAARVDPLVALRYE